ncbi:MAG: hypothetical protein K2H43_01755, partial [Clostridia bacterium]|nr:hypothetical protein [Clostridia bacterium]
VIIVNSKIRSFTGEEVGFMGRKSVAVLDVRSSEIAVIVGERGVNDTFVFKASITEDYDGYDEDVFFDEDKLSEAIVRAVTAAEQTCGERIRDLYIGVPGAFTEAVPKEQVIGFPKKRKIGQKEIEALYESGKEDREGYRFMRASSMIYKTADNRRVVDPSGLSSSVLSGILSYFYCSEYFIGIMDGIFGKMNISAHYLPTQYAMAVYLIPSETRDEYALLLDVGYLSSSVLVLLGNGVLAQRTFWAGKGQIAALIMQRFSIPYDAALALLGKANLYARSNSGRVEFMHRGASYEIDIDTLIETVKEGLDDLCENVSAFLESCSGKELDFKPLYVTGEGLFEIRGALEHVSKRVNRVCEQLAPDLPYYNKPSMSSRIALLDMAAADQRRSGFLYRFFNGFGG